MITAQTGISAGGGPANAQTIIGVDTLANIATKYPAASYPGALAIATDIGADGVGSLWRSSGTAWRRLHAIRLVDAGAPVSVTNTTVETQVFSATIPANVMGPSGKLRIYALWTMTNSANAKTLKVTFGGQTMYSVAGFASMAQLAQLHHVINRTASTQICANGPSLGLGNTTGTVATGTVDTTSAQTLSITAKMAALAETISLEAVFVEVV